MFTETNIKRIRKRTKNMCEKARGGKGTRKECRKMEKGEQRKEEKKTNLVRVPLQLEASSPMITIYCY